MSAYTPEEINALRPEVTRGGFGGGDPSRWLATVDALRAERDEVAKAERERIARKFDDKATTCRAMLKVETNIGRLAEYARAVAEWEFCAAMAREEAK